MKRHLSDSDTENCDLDDYEDCSSPEVRVQMSRKKRRGLIEKRRRDRINSCLVQLRKLVPAAFEKQGSAKLEKAEILQMTVEHLRYLQSRDPRGFGDPYLAYGGNTKAYLDHGMQGFKECAAEIARFMATSDGGMDPTDGSQTRLLGHLENVISQKELAIAALTVNPQIKLGSQPVSFMSMPGAPQTFSIPYAAPLTPPRASPDNLSPPAGFPGTNFGATDSLPHFSVAFPIPTTPIFSLASSTNRTMPATVFQTSSFKPVIPVAQAAPVSVVKPAPLLNGLPRPTAQPLTVITTAPTNAIATSPITPTSPPNFTVQAGTNMFTLTAPKSPMKTNSLTKAPFRPWADSTKTTLTTNA